MDLLSTVGMAEKAYRVRHMLKFWQWWRNGRLEKSEYKRLHEKLRVVRHGFDQMEHSDKAFLYPFRIDQAESRHRQTLLGFSEYLKDVSKTLQYFGWEEADIDSAFPSTKLMRLRQTGGPVAEELAHHDRQLTEWERIAKTPLFHVARRLKAADQRAKGIVF
jgi:uncharacterized protein Usg